MHFAYDQKFLDHVATRVGASSKEIQDGIQNIIEGDMFLAATSQYLNIVTKKNPKMFLIIKSEDDP